VLALATSLFFAAFVVLTLVGAETRRLIPLALGVLLMLVILFRLQRPLP
jgi:hypothetical protein